MPNTRHLPITDVTKENDTKFRGPLSYRHLRILGWLFIIFTQVAVILGLVSSARPDAAGDIARAGDIFSFFGQLSLPLFLLANFSFMLRTRKNGYKRLLTFYGLIALAFFLGCVYVNEHYFVRLLVHGGETFESANQIMTNLVNSLFSDGLAFNVFIDLFLCTLTFFFINYRPKKFFQSKKIYLFRSFAILPILYEVGSLIIKALSLNKVITIPALVFPLLTNKPPLTFVAFVAIVIFIKAREIYFVKKGKTYAEYDSFLETNRNSFDVAVATSIIFGVVAVIDFIIFLSLSLTIKGMEQPMNFVYKMGFGQSVGLILSIPFVLLFSYTREYENTKFDTILPIVGICAIVFTYVEGIFTGLVLA